MKTAAGVIRVSTTGQLVSGYGKEQQQEGISNYAGSSQIRIVDWIVDDITGTTPIKDRPGGKKIYSHLQNHSVDALIFHRVDRVTRDEDLIEIHELRRDVRNAGLELHYADRGKSDLSPIGSIYDHIAATMAAEDRIAILKKLSDARRQKVKEGSTLTMGRPPYGYKAVKTIGIKGRTRDTERLEVDDTEAAIVRLIYKLCIEAHWSVFRIAQHLRDRGIPTRGDLEAKYRRKGGKKTPYGWWEPSAVHNILTREVYATGIWHYNKTRSEKRKTIHRRPKEEHIPVKVPTIIDLATFHTAQTVLRENKTLSRRNSKRTYALKGRLKCAKCGHAYTGCIGNGIGGYRCSHNRNMAYGQCTGSQVPAPLLEQYVWEFVGMCVLNPDSIRSRVEVDNSHLEQELKAVEEELAALSEERNVLINLAGKKKITEEEFDERAVEITRRRLGLTNRQDELKLSFQVVDTTELVDQLKDRILNATAEDVMYVLRVLKVQIRIDAGPVKRRIWVSVPSLLAGEVLIDLPDVDRSTKLHPL